MTDYVEDALYDLVVGDGMTDPMQAIYWGLRGVVHALLALDQTMTPP